MKRMLLTKRVHWAAVCLAIAVGCGDDDDDGNGATGGTGGAGGNGAAGVGGTAGTGGTGGAAGTAGTGGTAGAAGSAGSAGTAGTDDGGPDAGEPDAGEPDDGGVPEDEGEEPDAGEEADAGESVVTLVTYTEDIQPILLARCSPCHETANEGGHNSASLYDDAVIMADLIVANIATGNMPRAGFGNEGCDGGDPGDPGCVTEEEFALIQEWVDGGTPE